MMMTTVPNCEKAAISFPNTSAKSIRPRLYERKSTQTLTARGKDGIRRNVLPYVSAAGQIGWIARENQDPHLITAYPIRRLNSHEGRMIMRAIMRAVVTGEMDVRGNYDAWNFKVRQAIEFAQALRLGHSSDHEHFRLDSYPEYREWFDPELSRREQRSKQLQGPCL